MLNILINVGNLTIDFLASKHASRLIVRIKKDGFDDTVNVMLRDAT